MTRLIALGKGRGLGPTGRGKTHEGPPSTPRVPFRHPPECDGLLLLPCRVLPSPLSPAPAPAPPRLSSLLGPPFPLPPLPPHHCVVLCQRAAAGALRRRRRPAHAGQRRRHRRQRLLLSSRRSHAGTQLVQQHVDLQVRVVVVGR